MLGHVRLCYPMDCNPSGSSVHGILLARILEQVSTSSSQGSPQSRDGTHTSQSPALQADSLPLVLSENLYVQHQKYSCLNNFPPWVNSLLGILDMQRRTYKPTKHSFLVKIPHCGSLSSQDNDSFVHLFFQHSFTACLLNARLSGS